MVEGQESTQYLIYLKDNCALLSVANNRTEIIVPKSCDEEYHYYICEYDEDNEIGNLGGEKINYSDDDEAIEDDMIWAIHEPEVKLTASIITTTETSTKSQADPSSNEISNTNDLEIISSQETEVSTMHADPFDNYKEDTTDILQELSDEVKILETSLTDIQETTTTLEANELLVNKDSREFSTSKLLLSLLQNSSDVNESEVNTQTSINSTAHFSTPLVNNEIKSTIPKIKSSTPSMFNL